MKKQNFLIKLNKKLELVEPSKEIKEFFLSNEESKLLEESFQNEKEGKLISNKNLRKQLELFI